MKAFTSPFIGASVDEVRQFAINHFDGENISSSNIVVLDQETLESSTCLLVTPKDFPEHEGEYRTVRSEFGQSLSILNAIEFGCAGEDMIGRHVAADGVVRQRAE